MTSYLLYGYALLTVFAFLLGQRISRRLKSNIFNPFVLGLLFLCAVLLTGNIPYQDYYQGNALFNNLLGIAVVAFALPFYEQFPKIRVFWKQILLISALACLFSIITGAGLAILFGAEKSILAATLPKSVTTPIAIAITHGLGGEAALSAIGVTIAGIVGSAFGYALLKKLGIHDPRAIGLALGASSHVLGTARAMEEDVRAGSFGSIALVLCGVLTSLIAPFAYHLVSS